MLVLRSPVESLRCLLSAVDGKGSWTQLVLGDLRLLKQGSGGKLDNLGDPAEYLGLWQNLIHNYPTEWRGLVRGLCYFHCPQLGPQRPAAACDFQPRAGRHLCDQCGQSFPTERGRNMHQRKVHGVRSDMRCFAPKDGRCPVCLRTFSIRLRLVAHLMEKRVRGGRIPCGAVVTEEMRLPDRMVRELDEQDKEQRRKAQRVGRTQPRSTAEVRPPPKKRTLTRKTGPASEQWQLVHGIALLCGGLPKKMRNY